MAVKLSSYPISLASFDTYVRMWYCPGIGSEHVYIIMLEASRDCVRDVHLYHKQKFTYRSEVNVCTYVSCIIIG